MSDLRPLTGDSPSRAGRLDRVLSDLLAQAPEIEAAAVVSYDGLPMVSALPPSMDEDRVAAMSAALLSLGERAAEGLGRGQLSQVYIEGETGTVFLVSCDDEAVLVAVAAAGAKAGLMLYEVRRSASQIAKVLIESDAFASPAVPNLPHAPVQQTQPVQPMQPVQEPVYQQPAVPTYAPVGGVGEPNGYPSNGHNGMTNGSAPNGWTSYAPGTGTLPGDPTPWS